MPLFGEFKKFEGAVPSAKSGNSNAQWVKISSILDIMPQAVALLAAGYRWNSKLLLAFYRSRQAERTIPWDLGPLHCFDSSVCSWAGLAMERTSVSFSE
jgi:hypothetical protein